LFRKQVDVNHNQGVTIMKKSTAALLYSATALTFLGLAQPALAAGAKQKLYYGWILYSAGNGNYNCTVESYYYQAPIGNTGYTVVSGPTQVSGPIDGAVSTCESICDEFGTPCTNITPTT
jgi:hypothetical protein